MTTTDITVKGTLTAYLHDEHGTLLQTFTKDNLVVQVGKNFLANAVIANSATPFVAIAIGSSATAPVLANTTLGAETARVAFGQSVTGSVVTMTSVFGAGIGTGTLAESGIFNNSVSGGTMLSRIVFTSITKNAGDSFTAIWTVTIA